MSQYVITTDLARPAQAERYFGAQCREFGGKASRTEAVWVTKFGIPNQLMLLQCPAVDGSVPPPPAVPDGVELLSRARDIVEAIRPFPKALGDVTMCELRIYDIAPSKGDDFLARKRAILPVRERYSPNFGVFASVTGRSYRVMHLWGYRSVDERDGVRARLKQDNEWQNYIAAILPMIDAMQSILITPVMKPLAP